MNHKNLNQLLCAATINGRFRDLLLRDPARAISAGYFDHRFSLTPEERDLVVGIRAQRLEDFAAQVYNWISGSGAGNGNGAGISGNGHRVNGSIRQAHERDSLVPSESFVDLYRVPLTSHA